MLRLALQCSLTVGVVGDGSAGKDAAIKAVFGVDTGRVNPVACSTSRSEIYPLDDTGIRSVLNFPGFNDHRPEVNKEVEDLLGLTNVFLVVLDISRGGLGTEVQIVEKIRQRGRPFLVCLNKSDLVRPKDRSSLLADAKRKLGPCPKCETAFDPDPRLVPDGHPAGVDEVRRWLDNQMEQLGKAKLDWDSLGTPHF